jgi:hypothetical protein
MIRSTCVDVPKIPHTALAFLVLAPELRSTTVSLYREALNSAMQWIRLKVLQND